MKRTLRRCLDCSRFIKARCPYHRHSHRRPLATRAPQPGPLIPILYLDPQPVQLDALPGVPLELCITPGLDARRRARP